MQEIVCVMRLLLIIILELSKGNEMNRFILRETSKLGPLWNTCMCKLDKYTLQWNKKGV